ncbi:MAG: hypothetical protein ACOCX4_05495 [Planctomycetota bacterium]
MSTKERELVRSLAKEYAAAAADPVMEERRQLWRNLHNLKVTRPPIYVRAFAWKEMPQKECACEDPFLRGIEAFFRNQLFRYSFGDDTVLDPWFTVGAALTCWGWGLSGDRTHSAEAGGSWKVDYPVKDLEADLEKLRPPQHGIDEAATAERLERTREVIGDILPVTLDRGPAYRNFAGDISTDLHYLRGIENFMLDMMDNPGAYHRLLAFMRDGVLRTHDQAEAAGDWCLVSQGNQAFCFGGEGIREPAPDVCGVPRKDLWCFCAAQEHTLVSPAMHDEFLFQYQKPILEHFGQVAYGCCEDLSKKIDMLRQLPNLRRIAVSPMADVGACAEQIGTDYVISYRPSPADMVAYGFDPDRVRTILRQDFAALRGTHFDITLKDVETVEGDPDRCRRWTAVVREEIDRYLSGE